METPKTDVTKLFASGGSAGEKMSSSLKERLKRCGRYRASPLAGQPGKKVCLDKPSTCLQELNISQVKYETTQSEDCQNPVIPSIIAQKTNLFDTEETKVSQSTSHAGDTVNTPNLTHQKGFEMSTVSLNPSDKLSGCMDIHKLKVFKLELKDRIQAKEEEARKLKMAKFYRTKNDVGQLEHLVGKWKSVCQESIEELQNSAPEPKPTIAQLIDHLKLDHEMIGFDKEDASFT